MLPKANKKVKKLSSEERLRRRRFAMIRFKAAVRFVIDNLYWIREELLYRDGKRFIETSRLTMELRYLMLSDIESRDDATKKKILSAMGSNFFILKGYPTNVRQELLLKSKYVYITPNRIMLRENCWPKHLYCLLKGKVKRYFTTINPVTGKPEQTLENVHCPFSTFAEIALLNQISQPFLVQTVDHCEFLVIEQSVYNEVLDRVIRPTWRRMIAFFKQNHLFNGFNDVNLYDVVRRSFLEYFDSFQVVLGDGHGRSDYMYFICKGICQLVHKVSIDEVFDGRVTHYRLHKEDGSNLPFGGARSRQREYRLPSVTAHPSMFDQSTLDKRRKIITKVRFFQVGLFTHNMCFNVGEDMSNRRVISQSAIEVISIPRSYLTKKTHDCRWESHRYTLEKSLPNNDEHIFKQFYLDERWRCFKKELIFPIVERKKIPVHTTVHDIALYTRTQNATNN